MTKTELPAMAPNGRAQSERSTIQCVNRFGA